jgi:hypothetical protein
MMHHAKCIVCCINSLFLQQSHELNPVIFPHCIAEDDGKKKGEEKRSAMSPSSFIDHY